MESPYQEEASAGGTERKPFSWKVETREGAAGNEMGGRQGHLGSGGSLEAIEPLKKGNDVYLRRTSCCLRPAGWPQRKLAVAGVLANDVSSLH